MHYHHTQIPEFNVVKNAVDIGLNKLSLKATYVTFSIIFHLEEVPTEVLFAKDRFD